VNKLRDIAPDSNLEQLCALFGKTRQAFYQRLNYAYQEYAEDGIILDLVYEFRKEMERLGGRKLWMMINQRLPDRFSVGRDRLFALLDREHLKVHRKKRKVRTTYSSRWSKNYPNLIKEIIPTASNQIWVSDITYIDTLNEGFVYLHLLSDNYSKKILGWCLSRTLHADHTIEALQMAIRNVGVKMEGLIHHSDRGCQYCCEKYVKLLQENKIRISMTENGNPRENAVAERINGILKMEWLNYEHFQGLSDARLRIAQVIDIYNNKRPHLSLDYATPARAYFMAGELPKRWKNYYTSNKSPEDKEKIILSLTTDARTPFLKQDF
jgi:transposase InsO family protein